MIAPFQHNALDAVLKQFTPISLEEMDAVKLMNRQDTKFVAPYSKLTNILQKLSPDYFVLEIGNNRVSNYSSLYFDTANKEAYRLHHNGKSNRYKIRYRSYIESDLSFFEIKFKSNKGRTIKKRIQKPEILRAFDEQDKQLLLNNSSLNPNTLKPTVWIYFRRITLVSKTQQERVTIDLDLKFKNSDNEKEVESPDLIIFEVKQPRFTRKSKVISVLKDYKVYPIRISKYCLGIMSCFQTLIKKNNFKKKLHKIAKITANEHYRNIIKY